MNAARATTTPLRHADRFFIGGDWVEPSSDATVDVIDSGTEEVYYTIAAAAPDDMSRAVAAARHAFDDGPWARLTHAARAEYIRALGAALAERNDVLSQLWPRESGVLYKTSQYAGRIGSGALASYAALADTFPFEEECPPTGGGEFGLLVREPVGVVGAIIPWNAPVALICHKIGPALLAGCTVVLKSAPEAPGEGYVFAEVGRTDRPAAGSTQRRHRRPRGFGAARPRQRGGQDHVHGIDRGRPAHRVAVRRADRAVHARARREVGGGRPRRHGSRDRRHHPRRAPSAD